MNNKEKLRDLAISIKSGDQFAFKALYDLYYIKLSAYINGFTKNEHETEDILQETFIKFWNSREKLDTIDYINSYLYRTAYYTYIDKHRKDKREENTLDSWKYKRLMEAIEEDEDINLKRTEKLKLVITKLPKRCQEVFVLCKYENLTHVQIAERLNISPKTVQAQMSRAYKLIKERFNDKGLLNLFLHFINVFNLSSQKETFKDY